MSAPITAMAVPSAENLHKCSIQEHLLIFMMSGTARVFQMVDFPIQTHICVAGFRLKTWNILINFVRNSDIAAQQSQMF